MLKKFDGRKLYILSWEDGLLVGDNAKFMAKRIRDASMWEIDVPLWNSHPYIQCDAMKAETILNAFNLKGNSPPEKIDEGHPRLVIALCDDATEMHFVVSDNIIKACKYLIKDTSKIVQICILEPLKGELKEIELPTLIDVLLKIKGN